MVLFVPLYRYIVFSVCILFFVFCDIDYLISVSRSPKDSFAVEDNITRLHEQGEDISTERNGLFPHWVHFFQDIDETHNEEVDTTIYVHNVTEIDRISQFHEGVVLWNYHGGFANQMYSLISSLILAEVKQVPFFCICILLKSFT